MPQGQLVVINEPRGMIPRRTLARLLRIQREQDALVRVIRSRLAAGATIEAGEYRFEQSAGRVIIGRGPA